MARRLKQFQLSEDTAFNSDMTRGTKEERVLGIQGERKQYLRRKDLPPDSLKRMQEAPLEELRKRNWRLLSDETIGMLGGLTFIEQQQFGRWLEAKIAMKRLGGRFFVARLEGEGRMFEGEGELNSEIARYKCLEKACNEIDANATARKKFSSNGLKDVLASAEKDLAETRPSPTNVELLAALNEVAEEILYNRDSNMSSSKQLAERRTRFFPFAVEDKNEQATILRLKDDIDKQLVREKLEIALEVVSAQRKVVDEIYITPRRDNGLRESCKNDCVYFTLEAAQSGLREKLEQMRCSK